jgi:hypothetical protein
LVWIALGIALIGVALIVKEKIEVLSVLSAIAATALVIAAVPYSLLVNTCVLDAGHTGVGGTTTHSGHHRDRENTFHSASLPGNAALWSRASLGDVPVAVEI